PLLRLVAGASHVQHGVEIARGDLLATDDGDVAGLERRGTAAPAACGREQRDGQGDDDERDRTLHGKCAISSGRAHAAWRAASIASTNRSACGKPSSRRVISRFATV